MFSAFFKGIFGTRKKSNNGNSRNSQTRKKSHETRPAERVSPQETQKNKGKSPPNPQVEQTTKVLMRGQKSIALFQRLDDIINEPRTEEKDTPLLEKMLIRVQQDHSQVVSIKTFSMKNEKLDSLTVEINSALKPNSKSKIHFKQKTFKKEKKVPVLSTIEEVLNESKSKSKSRSKSGSKTQSKSR